MNYKNIHFIINPISGKGKGLKLKSIIETKFKNYNYIIKVTTGKNDAHNKAKTSINENADLIVSCGGDGTFNEIASALVYTNVPVAIIPIGSGNGLARNLKISLNSEKAIDNILSSSEPIKIDCGKANNNYFFSNMGIGFDASVIKTYSNQTQRKIIGYIKSILLTSLKFSAIKLSAKCNNIKIDSKFMMFFISNSNCMGYFVSATPKASPCDGKLDVVAIKKCNKFIFSLISLQLLFRCLNNKKTIQLRTDKITLNKEIDFVQIDGEYREINDNLNIEVIKKAISIIPGKDFK